jgi:hypothetical protein
MTFLHPPKSEPWEEGMDIPVRHFLFYDSVDNSVRILDGAIVGTYADYESAARAAKVRGLRLSGVSRQASLPTAPAAG